MVNLIAILISLLGYGTPQDFSNLTEAQLNAQIEQQQAIINDTEDDGRGGDWDLPN